MVEIKKHDIKTKRLGGNRYEINVDMVVTDGEKIFPIKFRRRGGCFGCVKKIVERKLNDDFGLLVELEVMHEHC